MVERSFCMTSYNAGKKLSPCLDSILPFLGVDDEFICIDNYSKDDTWKIFNDYKQYYFDKNISLYQYKCGRGKGRQLGYEKSKGKYLIFVDADTVYKPLFWKVLSLWENNRLSDYCYLSLNEAWHLPRNLITRLGGFPNLSANDDVWLFYKALELDAFRWCPVSIGVNWLAENKEKRFTSNVFELVWRNIMNQRDKFITDPRIHLFSYIKHYRKLIKRSSTFFLFWIPLFCLLSCIKPFIKLPKVVEFNKDWVIDFGLDKNLERYDWFFWYTKDNIKNCLKMRKLNLGCGVKVLDGYENYDMYPVNDKVEFLNLNKLPLPFKNDSVDEILLDNVLEHLGCSPYDFIKELYRILKKDGILKINLPVFACMVTHNSFYHPSSYFCPITEKDKSIADEYGTDFFRVVSFKKKRKKILVGVRRLIDFVMDLFYDEYFWEMKKT